MERPPTIATGVPQLDVLLGGGIVQNSLLLIAGQTGSGKTVLAAQIASAAADRGDPVLFITAFSEPHGKLLTNLRPFSFFKPEIVGGSLKLLNLQHQLIASTTEAADTIVREAREQRAKLIILDGFQGVRMTSVDPAAPHQFLYDLSSKLGLLGVTGIVTYDLASVEEAPLSELSAVDGMILLDQDLLYDQAIRTIQVVKQRGALPLLGRHTFQIADAGVTCYPRQESITLAFDASFSLDRIASGVAGLDDLLHGGISQDTTTIIAGAEGVGKTLLSLQFALQGVADGTRAIIISFYETAAQLVAKGRAFGLDLQTALDRGALTIQRYSPFDLNADMVAQQLRDTIADRPVQRLVIDGFNEVERALIVRGRAASFFPALVTFLQRQHITTCITLEIDPVIGQELSFAGKNLATFADNILLLRRSSITDESAFTAQILKMRFSNHGRQPEPYTIGDTGLIIGGANGGKARAKRRSA